MFHSCLPTTPQSVSRHAQARVSVSFQDIVFVRMVGLVWPAIFQLARVLTSAVAMVIASSLMFVTAFLAGWVLLAMLPTAVSGMNAMGMGSVLFQTFVLVG